MPKHSKILRKIELTKEEREGLDLRNTHSVNKHIVKPSTVLSRYNPHAYDRLEEMNRQTSAKGRAMGLVHNASREQAKTGHVVSVSNAGSGHRFFVNKGKLQSSKNTISVTDKNGTRVLRPDTREYLEREEKVYGQQITNLKDKNGKEISTLHVRRKETNLENGESIVHVNMAGPLGKVAYVPKLNREGTLNSGEYEIGNLREYIVQQGLAEVDRILKEEQRNPQSKKDTIFLDFRGHSRGAVATLEGAMALNYALREKYGDDVYSRIKFDISQFDPVPGAGTRHDKRVKVDLYGEPPENENLDKGHRLLPFKEGQVNSTVLYSMYQQHGAGLFIPEQIIGSDRVIFTLTDHDVNLNKQENYREITENENGDTVEIADAESHRLGYTNASDGKKYRSSGLTGLEKGIYIADENNNLVKIRNKEELKKVFDGILAVSGHQKGRYEELLGVANAWFDRNGQQLVPPEERNPQEPKKNQQEPERPSGLTRLIPDRKNIETVVYQAREHEIPEEDIVARITRQNVAERNDWATALPDFSPLKKEDSVFKYCMVKSNAESNHREYLSRCAVKTMAAVLSHDIDATRDIHLEGMSDAIASVFLEHNEGAREINLAFAEKYNQATPEKRKEILSSRLADVTAAAFGELRKHRTDDALVQDYDAAYGRLKNFDAIKPALEYMRQNDLLDPGTAQDLMQMLPAVANRWKEMDRQMAVISDPCYRHIDLSMASAMPAADFENVETENPRLAPYFKKVRLLNHTRDTGRSLSVRKDVAARAVTGDQLASDFSALEELKAEGERVNKGAFIGSSEFRDLRRQLNSMTKLFDELSKSNAPGIEITADLKKACEDTLRVATLYQTKKQSEISGKIKGASEREQNRMNFADRVIRFARGKMDVLNANHAEKVRTEERMTQRYSAPETVHVHPTVKKSIPHQVEDTHQGPMP